MKLSGPWSSVHIGVVSLVVRPLQGSGSVLTSRWAVTVHPPSPKQPFSLWGLDSSLGFYLRGRVQETTQLFLLTCPTPPSLFLPFCLQKGAVASLSLLCFNILSVPQTLSIILVLRWWKTNPDILNEAFWFFLCPLISRSYKHTPARCSNRKEKEKLNKEEKKLNLIKPACLHNCNFLQLIVVPM